MATNIKEFLESFGLYERYSPRDGVWWNGEWPDVVVVPCRTCGERRPHTMFASKVAGFSHAWGVYMINGSCAHCASDGLMFWVEVNHREGWMQKAGQLPGATESKELLARPA